MYRLLLGLMVAEALLRLGFGFSDISNMSDVSDVLLCNSPRCHDRIERAAREVLDVDWRPISLFPEEAQRFR